VKGLDIVEGRRTPTIWYVVRGTVTALRMCNAFVVPDVASKAARLKVPDTAFVAPAPRAEQSAYAVAAVARRARMWLKRIEEEELNKIVVNSALLSSTSFETYIEPGDAEEVDEQ
jgi:hypothetical protein